jgi:adenylate kinase
MGEGIFAGMPLALAGTRRLLEQMDWGNEEDKANFIRFGAVGKPMNCRNIGILA